MMQPYIDDVKLFLIMTALCCTVGGWIVYLTLDVARGVIASMVIGGWL